MKRALALVLATAMAFPGCAVRLPRVAKAPLLRAARMTSSHAQAKYGADQAAWERYVSNLPIGARVKVETRDGESFKGTYMGAENGHINVKPRTRVPEPVRVIPIASLASVELDQGSSVGRTAAIAAAVAAATVFGMFLVLSVIVSD